MCETNWLAHGLDEHSNCSNAVIINKGLQCVFNTSACLVADRHHVGHVQPALLHGEVDAHVATLRNDANSVLHWSTTVFVGPQSYSIKCVDVSVTVWAKDGKFPGTANEFGLQFNIARFCESRGVTHCATGAHCAELCNCIKREVAIYRYECCVRHARQVCK